MGGGAGVRDILSTYDTTQKGFQVPARTSLDGGINAHLPCARNKPILTPKYAHTSKIKINEANKQAKNMQPNKANKQADRKTSKTSKQKKEHAGK